jgi:hypothetical protein
MDRIARNLECCCEGATNLFNMSDRSPGRAVALDQHTSPVATAWAVRLLSTMSQRKYDDAP